MKTQEIQPVTAILTRRRAGDEEAGSGGRIRRTTEDAGGSAG